jgi:DNA-binding MarR family transcriptional regulator
MRAARGSYKRGIDGELAARGITSLPRSGGFVIALLSTGTESVEEIVRGLGVSKQAFSQLIDALVTRGYVTRDQHPLDRRRIVLQLTDQGQVAASAVMTGAKAVDDRLQQRLTASELHGLRKGLTVLGEIKESFGEQG